MCVCVCVSSVHAKFYLLSYNISFSISVEPKAKESFCKPSCCCVFYMESHYLINIATLQLKTLK